MLWKRVLKTENFLSKFVYTQVRPAFYSFYVLLFVCDIITKRNMSCYCCCYILVKRKFLHLYEFYWLGEKVLPMLSLILLIGILADTSIFWSTYILEVISQFLLFVETLSLAFICYDWRSVLPRSLF